MGRIFLRQWLEHRHLSAFDLTSVFSVGNGLGCRRWHSSLDIFLVIRCSTGWAIVLFLCTEITTGGQTKEGAPDCAPLLLADLSCKQRSKQRGNACSRPQVTNPSPGTGTVHWSNVVCARDQRPGHGRSRINFAAGFDPVQPQKRF